jgi:hypothetical protein
MYFRWFLSYNDYKYYCKTVLNFVNKENYYVDNTISNRNALWFRNHNVCDEQVSEMRRLLETGDCY